MSISADLQDRLSRTLEYVQNLQQKNAESYGGYPAPVEQVGDHVVSVDNDEGEMTLNVYTPSEFVKIYEGFEDEEN